MLLERSLQLTLRVWKVSGLMSERVATSTNSYTDGTRLKISVDSSAVLLAFYSVPNRASVHDCK